ncbi:glucose transporter GlcP-like [Diabrotica undecimpunctata]|uniref:glucose transporter GlcP-like n=1 Tax=Diabrotica undecimpunctata TaxID=50387 RepID=UPI003B6358CD
MKESICKSAVQATIKIRENNFDLSNGAKSSWLFYFSICSANILLISVGSMMVWPSSVIPKLFLNDTELNPFGRPITAMENSILLSTCSFISLFGFIGLVKLADFFGRKTIIRTIGILYLACLIIIAFGKNIYVYYVFCSIIGVLAAGAIIIIAIYNGEICTDHERTWVGCMVGFMVPAGNLFGYIIGSLVEPVKELTLIYALPLVLHAILSFFMVESPIYLACKNKKLEGISTLDRLRKFRKYGDAELEYLKIEQFNISRANLNRGPWAIFRSPNSRKALFLGFVIYATQELSGFLIIVEYLVPIFNDIALLPGNAISILFGFTHMVIIFLATVFVNKSGKRPLLLFSTLGCSGSMALMAFYFYSKQYELHFLNKIHWLPVICILLFVISYGMGLGPLPIGIVGELFDNEVRVTGYSAVTLPYCILAVGSNFAYPLICNSFGVYMCMLFYSFSCVIGFIIFYFYLPETGGKSFMEIQSLLQKNKN